MATKTARSPARPQAPAGLLRSLERSWQALRDLEKKGRELETQARDEVYRLLRTEHKAWVIRQLYWTGEARRRLAAQDLATLAGVPVRDLPELAGALGLEVSCLGCKSLCRVTIPNRTALEQAEAELEGHFPAGKTEPTWRICSSCRQGQAATLAELRKAPGARLTQRHRDAYRRYLLSDAWRARRKRALKRAKHRCQLCSSRVGLEVHHRTYERIGQERPEDLTVLCGRCHGGHHGH